jgi:outer membrane protein
MRVPSGEAQREKIKNSNQEKEMRPVRVLFSCLAVFIFSAIPLRAQNHFPAWPPLTLGTSQENLPDMPAKPQFQNYIVNGKVELGLDDAIRLALANDTDIRLDESQIQTSKDSVERARSPFDPVVNSSFNATRVKSGQFSELGGAPTLSQLSQITLANYSETFETGTNVQAAFSVNKYSSNSSFFFINPAISTNLTLTFTQPLLRGRGLFANRAPILIAQRTLAQTRANFEAEVNDIILQVVTQYWNVVQARGNLAVQKESLDEAQKSYERDKRSLQLGALPPLDIYRSESQVASRRVSEIQAEYAVKQTEDQFRRIIGADVDPNIRALDLDLTEEPNPSGTLLDVDIPTALGKALQYRPEVLSVRQQLAGDDMNIRLARNNTEPQLSISGMYQGNGLGGDQFSFTVPGQIVSRTGFASAFTQMFGSTYPGYGFTVSLTLPVRNHLAEANLADARSSKEHDLYAQRQVQQAITLDVANAVHQLEESKLSMAAAKIALNLSQKTLDAEQHKYELGAETVFFVLEAQTELTAAQQALLQAQVNYQLAVAAVEHATGDLLKRFQVQITGLAK